MWHWDQGHLAYFQFDALRAVARYIQNNDFKVATAAGLLASTGLAFPAPPTHSPWRQYSRVLKHALLLSERNDVAEPTALSALLAQPGEVTADEYFHFLARVSTEPSPALEGWSPTAPFRYPILFSLKYLLAKAIVGADPSATVYEIIGAYRATNFTGAEQQADFTNALTNAHTYHDLGRTVPDDPRRQARESIKVFCQISYLRLVNGRTANARVFITLNPIDAERTFAALTPIGGPRAADRDAEIRRLASLFAGAANLGVFGYENTVVSEVVESGFPEGNKVKKTHVTVERNAGLRRAFFEARPTTVCDVCSLDTHQTYPWTERVMDLHHLLPLSSGTRVVDVGTTFDDLVPLCPSCHRGVHRYYNDWLSTANQLDFQSRDEAVGVYTQMKTQFPGLINA